jgi:uncharacterized membrane protein
MPPKSFYQRLWQYFLTGLFVLAPAGLTVLVVVWLVQAVDRIFRFQHFGLGFLVTFGLVTLLGMMLSSALGKQLFRLFEEIFLHIPMVRAIYKTVKALTDAFSPNSVRGFKHVVLVEYPHPGALSLGFITSEMIFTDSEGRPDKWAVVYVPTNHLYLGNSVAVPKSRVHYTTLTVPEGVQIILATGAGFPDQKFSKADDQKNARQA